MHCEHAADLAPLRESAHPMRKNVKNSAVCKTRKGKPFVFRHLRVEMTWAFPLIGALRFLILECLTQFAIVALLCLRLHRSLLTGQAPRSSCHRQRSVLPFRYPAAKEATLWLLFDAASNPLHENAKTKAVP